MDRQSPLPSGYIWQGKFAEAEDALRESLTIRRTVYGTDHIDVCSALNNLGNALNRRRKFEEAEVAMREALQINRRLFGNESSELTDILTELISPLEKQNKLTEAEAIAREAYLMRKKLLPRRHPYIGESLGNLANVLQRQGKTKEALYLYRDEIVETSNPTASVLNSFAWFLATCTDSTVRDGQRAVSLAEKAVSATNRKSPYILDTLAAAYAEAGRFTNAISTQKEAMELLHDEGMKKDFVYRLKLYESNTPFREK